MVTTRRLSRAPAMPPRVDLTVGTCGTTADSEPVPKVISGMVYYGSKSCSQDTEDLPEFDYSGIDEKQTMPEYSGTDEKQTPELMLSCGHIGKSLARRGFDIDKRFLCCPYKGYEACGYVKWLDDEWKGRARSIIAKLVEYNGKLKKKVKDLEGTIKGLNQECINHIKQMKATDKRELACVVVVAAVAIAYASFAMMIRGFV